MTLIDNKAPDFDLEGSDGRRHRLQDYAGRRLLLFFYPRDNTSGCTKEAVGFRDLKPEFEKLGFVILGISRDSLASHQRFIDNHELNMVLLSDPDARVMKAYHAFGEKMMYGKQVSGVIRSTVLICADGIIRKHWTKVAKAEQHPAQVLEYIKDFHCE
ncbi:peroxiredoxin [Trichlorobacter lovleyi]|uniref:thioredoxin-dependent peroxiredoxin n=1 Tax=Trichlorobacter lovleyi (strain ATCC BAA-1151 / DSM 17278 / SZ) TaxID=398767 RepID=B3E652_TRIL1|nr:peroxiredoxin [Trichlorobacter lovleyi]ACD94776.1 alkyl hydroperoxide reductase/ Thiol specific antioxidant/ Mal allergen [Trichlorobacter lovleyi SZ]